MSHSGRPFFAVVLCFGACAPPHLRTQAGTGKSLAQAVQELVTKDWRSTAPADLAHLWPQRLVAERPAIVDDRGTQGFFAAPFRPPCPETNIFLFLGRKEHGRPFEPRSLRTVTFWRSLNSPEEAKHKADELMLLLAMPRDRADWSPWENNISYLVLQRTVRSTKETAMARIEKQESCWSLMLTWTRFWDARDGIGFTRPGQAGP
jgi:hypothetical protein